MSLSEALIELSVASPEEVLDASARQELFGGDLITNLLDVRSVPEAQAQRALSMAYNLPVGPLGELPFGTGTAIAAIPRDVATQLGVYPCRLDETELVVAASEPLSSDNVDLLRRASGATVITVQVVLAPRVRQAISRDYSATMDRRTRKLIARLEGSEVTHSSRAPDVFAEAPSFSEMPRPGSIVPVTFFGEWADLETPSHSLFAAETAPAPTASARPRAGVSDSLESREAPRSRSSEGIAGVVPGPASRPREPGKRRGPITLTQAKQDLQRATRADHILRVYFGFASQYFDLAACFTLHGATARLRHARGFAWMQPSTREQALPLANHPALASVSETSHWLLSKLSASDPALCTALGFTRPVVSLLVPVRVRERATVVLLGAFEEEDVELENAAELFSFEPFVSRAFEQLIVARKTRSADESVDGPTSELASPSARSFPERFHARDSAQGFTNAEDPAPTALPPVSERA
jgi:Type II secretion system (T2SS), protein E, N-terminal domain